MRQCVVILPRPTHRQLICLTELIANEVFLSKQRDCKIFESKQLVIEQMCRQYRLYLWLFSQSYKKSVTQILRSLLLDGQI
jgi:hypothetical protein